jgi:hypothetical protein
VPGRRSGSFVPGRCSGSVAPGRCSGFVRARPALGFVRARPPARVRSCQGRCLGSFVPGRRSGSFGFAHAPCRDRPEARCAMGILPHLRRCDHHDLSPWAGGNDGLTIFGQAHVRSMRPWESLSRRNGASSAQRAVSRRSSAGEEPSAGGLSRQRQGRSHARPGGGTRADGQAKLPTSGWFGPTRAGKGQQACGSRVPSAASPRPSSANRRDGVSREWRCGAWRCG